MKHISPLDQQPLQVDFRKAFFDRLSQLATAKKPEYLSVLTSRLTPAFCTQDSVSQLSQFIKANPTLPPVVIKSLRVAHQEDKRCLAIREFSND